MFQSLPTQIIARVGENLHLLVIYCVGTWIAIRHRPTNPKVSNPLLTAFILFILSVLIAGFRIAWNDVRNFHEAFNAKDLSKTIPYVLSGGIHFILLIAAWVFLLFAITKALKESKQ